ncbi:MAG TPA: WD40 repeat domain-containing serine/threonine-protein kinase, partial [Planctomycetota bacterium]|nr:WD40 repeat domain-containing serine/threonine-protein kinase [Planctomycetota bacterium]
QTVKIGAYDVLSQLGRGGSGIVYLARGPDGAEVALKVLKRHSAESHARFERERSMLSRFDEASGFVPLLDAGVSPEGPFVVLRLMRGGTLRGRLEGGPLGVDEAVALVTALARAIGKAHALGIVHRDLKPENVLFDGGRALIVDLGLAKHFSSIAETREDLSITGEMRGTAGYMPLEQMKDAKNAGPEADVFALGAILYECLAGRPAFDAATMLATLEKVESGEFVPIREIRPETPLSVARAIERALAPDPEERYPDGNALAAALEGKGEAARRRWLWLALVPLVAIPFVAFALKGLPPAPVVTPPPRPPLPPPPPFEVPAACKRFARTKHLRLNGFAGSYAWRHERGVDSVLFSPSGEVVFSTGGWTEKSVRAWRAATGEEIWTRTFPSECRRLAVSPDGKWLAAGALDGSVHLLAAESGALLRDLPKHARECGVIFFQPGTSRLVSGGWDGVLRADAVDDESGEPLYRKERMGAIHAGALRPDGRILALAIGAIPLTILEADSGNQISALARGIETSTIAYSPSGETIAVATSEGTVSFYNGTTLTLGETWTLGHKVEALAFVDERRYVTGGDDGTIALHELGRPDALARHRARAKVRSLSVSADGGRVASGSWDGEVRVLDARTLEAPRAAWAGTIRLDAMVPLPGGRAVLGGDGGVLRLVDIDRGEVVLEKDLASGPISGVAASRDGTHAYVAIDGGATLVVDAATREVKPLKSNARGKRVLAVSASGRYLASGTAQGMLHVLDLATGVETATQGHEGGFETLGWSGDDRILAATSRGVVYVSTRTGELNHRLAVDPSWAKPARASFSPDGKRVLAACKDRLVLWDPSEVDPSLDLPHDRDMNKTAFLDDRYALVTSWDERVQVYDLDARKVLDEIDLSPTRDHAREVVVLGRDLYLGTARGVVLRFAFERP